MIKYKTIEKEGQAEQIIEKSKFMGYAKPVENKEEADIFFRQIRKLHKTATHHVPAYVIGDQFQNQWASDDGEPQGTSGAPMVQMMVKKGITNVAVIVVRYFGGIKLGTGGLVRAYTSTAQMALEASFILWVKERHLLTVKVDYMYHGKIQNVGTGALFHIEDTIYEEKVTLTLSMEPEQKEIAKRMILDITSGTAKIMGEREELRKIKG
ncbi:MAG: YigZ family protein [Anaerovorax sp.]